MLSLKSLLLALAVTVAGPATAALADDCGPRRSRGWDRPVQVRRPVRHDRVVHRPHPRASHVQVRLAPHRPPAVRVVITPRQHHQHGWVDHRRVSRARGCR